MLEPASPRSPEDEPFGPEASPEPSPSALVRLLATRPASLVRRRFGLLVSLIALAGFVLWAVRQDAPTFPSEPEDLALIAVALLAYAAATLIRGWRWHRIMLHGKVRHERADAFALCVVGYAGNNVLPARGGEWMRIFLLSERSGARKREVLGSVLAERVLDAVALALLLVLLSLGRVASSSPGDSQAVVALGLIAAVAAGAVVALMLRRRERLARVIELVRPVARASRRLLSPWGAALFVVTCGVWIIEGIIFWLVGESLGLGFSVLEGVFLLVLSSMFALIPAAPGYVGTFDAGVLVGLGRLGISDGPAVAFALLVRFVLYVPITVVGLILLAARYGGVRLLRTGSWRNTVDD